LTGKRREIRVPQPAVTILMIRRGTSAHAEKLIKVVGYTVTPVINGYTATVLGLRG
jgi:hypothetical protein